MILSPKTKVASAVAIVIAMLSFYNPRELEACKRASTGITPDYSKLNENGQTARDIYYYIESDFADELKVSTTWTTDDDVLSEAQVRNAIIAQAEKWNIEGTGQNLIYGGALSINNPANFCGLVGQKPAVFIYHEPSTTLPFGTVFSITDTLDFDNDGNTTERCPGVVAMRIGSRSYQNGTAFWFGSIMPDFDNVILHEFGHVLELGHAHEDNPISCHSVMGYSGSCNDSSNRDGNTGHLRKWDLDCVDAWQNDRNAEYRLLGFTSTGTQRPIVTVPDATTKTGFFGTNPIADGSQLKLMLPRYFLYSSSSWWATVGYDGYFSFSQAPQIPGYVRGSPIAYRLENVPNHEAGVSFTNYDQSSYDPPYLSFVNFTNGLANFNSGGWYNCTSSNCTTAIPTRSFLPLVPVFDPVSGETLYAETRALSEKDEREEQFIYPGHFSQSVSVLLSPRRLSTNFMEFPSTNSPWEFAGTNSFSPSVACADAAYGLEYNCMMVWVDSGMWDGSILYAYFKFNSQANRIDFIKNNLIQHVAWRRSTSNTATRPDVSFFAGKFWMAWKESGPPSRVALVSRSASTNYTAGWGPTSYFTEPNIATPPTFVAEDGRESALIWTVTP